MKLFNRWSLPHFCLGLLFFAVLEPLPWWRTAIAFVCLLAYGILLMVEHVPAFPHGGGQQ